MSNPQDNNTKIEHKIKKLEQCLKQKNQIIDHLQDRIKNQQKQLETLLMDSEEKSFQEIKKYYTKSLDKYLKNGKYLLIQIDSIQATGIYLPKNAKVVHFGEISKQFMQHQGTDKNKSNGKQAQHPPTPILRQKQSSQIESSVKGLNSQIQALKDKIKAYSSMIENKTENMSIISSESHKKRQFQSTTPKHNQQSEVKQFQYNDQFSQKTPKVQQRNKQGSDEKQYVKQLESKVKKYQQLQRSVSPIKKRGQTKVLYRRK